MDRDRIQLPVELVDDTVAAAGDEHPVTGRDEVVRVGADRGLGVDRLFDGERTRIVTGLEGDNPRAALVDRVSLSPSGESATPCTRASGPASIAPIRSWRSVSTTSTTPSRRLPE